jgi:hypothetical protein
METENAGNPDTHPLCHGLRIHAFASHTFGAEPRHRRWSFRQKEGACPTLRRMWVSGNPFESRRRMKGDILTTRSKCAVYEAEVFEPGFDVAVGFQVVDDLAGAFGIFDLDVEAWEVGWVYPIEFP